MKATDATESMVAGGLGFPSDRLLPNTAVVMARPPDLLGGLIADLVNTNAELQVQFRATDLSRLDDSTKQMLLDDMLAVLQVKVKRDAVNSKA